MLNHIASFMLGMSLSNGPADFVSIAEICPQIRIEANYATINNFTGEIVAGYKVKKALLAKGPAEALCRVQVEAQKRGLALKIFDAYRPEKAVAFFQEWALRPETRTDLKERFYPGFSRKELFDQGYIAKRSSHSRGSAVDLGLVDMRTGEELDMGSEFDYFDALSHTESPMISAAQLKNRLLLKELMLKEGFKNFSQEWWHYSFRSEPFPDRYFDFDVE